MLFPSTRATATEAVTAGVGVSGVGAWGGRHQYFLGIEVIQVPVGDALQPLVVEEALVILGRGRLREFGADPLLARVIAAGSVHRGPLGIQIPIRTRPF